MESVKKINKRNMKLFDYIYYRMYKSYRDKNDTPILSSYLYITLLQFFVLCICLIYLEKFIIYFNILSHASVLTVKSSYWFWGIIIFSLLVFSYLNYSIKSFVEFEKIYGDYNLLNRIIKIWMLLILPFFIFFVGIGFYIILFGGQVFGKDFKGVVGV